MDTEKSKNLGCVNRITAKKPVLLYQYRKHKNLFTLREVSCQERLSLHGRKLEMPMSMENITFSPPEGAKFLRGGATFKVRVPHATKVHVIGLFSGRDRWTPNESNLMNLDSHGYWAGFQPGVTDVDEFKYFIVYKVIVSAGTQEPARDPMLSLV